MSTLVCKPWELPQQCAKQIELHDWMSCTWQNAFTPFCKHGRDAERMWLIGPSVSDLDIYAVTATSAALSQQATTDQADALRDCLQLEYSVYVSWSLSIAFTANAP